MRKGTGRLDVTWALVITQFCLFHTPVKGHSMSSYNNKRLICFTEMSIYLTSHSVSVSPENSNTFAVFYSPPHIPMDSSWTPHGLCITCSKVMIIPSKSCGVPWSPRGVPMESSSSLGTIFWHEFNGDGGFVIRVTLCGKSGKHKCDPSSGTIFQCEFNGGVGFIIWVTIYGKSSKHTSVIHLQEPFINMN